MGLLGREAAICPSRAELLGTGVIGGPSVPKECVSRPNLGAIKDGERHTGSLLTRLKEEAMVRQHV